jgi:ABC-type polysaccharide/polyol phosphate export permease
MRWALLGTPAPSMRLIVYSAALAVVVWLIAAWLFSRAEQSFADEI